MSERPLVIYYTIKDPAQKLKLLCSVAEKHLHSKQSLHILSSDKTSLSFVSQLLWREPKEGFIVHSSEPTDLSSSLIKLILPQPSYTEAESIFNLTSQPLILPTPLKQVYEFEDLTHPSKKAIFERKFKLYQDAGYTLCSN